MSDLWGGLRYRYSLASRVTLLTTIAVGLSITAVAFAAYATVRAQTLSALDESLYNRASAAARAHALDVLATQSIPSWALGAADVKIIFLNALTDPPTVRSADTRATMGIGTTEIQVALGSAQSSARTIYEDEEPWRVVAVHADRGQALVLAQSLASTNRTLDRLGLVMLLFGISGMLSAALAGWAVARNGLRPVRRLTAAVERITRTQELNQIPVDGEDEIARLATAFNEMLVALSQSQRRQRQLVADASHELRTPLTSLRTNFDLLVQAGDSLPEPNRRELLADVNGQLAEMTSLIEDLVELARDQHDPHALTLVELSAVVRQAIIRVQRRTDAVFQVELQPWWLTGDPDALERAVINLLDNAAKWSPADGTIFVELTGGTLRVRDQGPGIATADLPHVFERFYRSSESRSMPGSGLGLSIVASIAERHGGQAGARNHRDGGAVMTLRLPGSSEEPPPDRDTG